MAASDPATDVATPTGVLQGVAAFSWDGAAWQPSGRAGPSVATPTGVLRGVAPFTGGGTSWTPAGRAQPGVPTPSGVLDGVAVYTWSGSAWTPPGGQSTPATPTGTLRGVAAFNWDGTAWQPAAQAGAEVATPYGVLDGVAMFNWSGSAWAAVGAPSLSLDFMQPGTLDPRITFTRASTATYFDSAGVMQTAAINTPRWDYDPVTLALRGMLIEEARTNSWVQSGDASNAAWTKEAVTVAAPVVTANQTTAPTGTLSAARVVYPTVTGVSPTRSVLSQAIAVTSGTPVTFSVYLKGNVGGEQLYVCTLGALAGRTLAILSTQWQRITLTIPTPGTGSGFFEIGCDLRDANQSAGIAAQTIYVWGAQVEVGAFATSHIPTTSAAVTRAFDGVAMPFVPASSGTWKSEFIPAGVAAGLPVIVSGNAGSPVMAIGVDSRLVASIKGGASVFSGVTPTLTFNAMNKAAFGYVTGGSKAAVNGTLLGANAVALTVSGTGVQFGSDGVTPGNNALNGTLRAAQYWPRVLTDAELQSITA